MVLRIILFKVVPELTDDDVSGLLSLIGAARRTVRGLQRVDIGRLVEDAAGYRIEGGEPVEVSGSCRYDYAVVFEFASREDLDRYLESPIQELMRKRLAEVIVSAVACNYEV